MINIEGIKPITIKNRLPQSHLHIVLSHTKTVVFCEELIITLFSQGQMNESLRIAISKELGFSDRINLDGTEYYKYV